MCVFVSGPVKSPDTGDAAWLHRPFGELVKLIKGFIPAWIHTVQ